MAIATAPAALREILEVPIGALRRNPAQPRRRFSQEGLEELAESIRQYGILNPLTIRPTADGRYELVAGERRLRAARMAGLESVPCRVLAVGEQDSALLALVENLQRRDLDFLEEAEGMARLIRDFGLRQEDVARRLGISQSAVANKLRLLRLDPRLLDHILSAGLTERHARALLRLPEELRTEALDHILQENLTVAATDAYAERLLATAPQPRRRTLFVLKDVRVFLNTLDRGLEVMRQGGIQADMKKQETDEALILTISIPRKRPG